MRVLVACEFSGIVREAFNAYHGIYAISCDLLPVEDGRKDYHYQGDVRDILNDGWDLMIAHPECTFLTVSAEWAYSDPNYQRYPGVGYHQKTKPGTLVGAERRAARDEAVNFFLTLWNSGIPHICMENPIGHISRYMKDAFRQIIQPYDFGDDASKSTCLWLKNLPPLSPTKYIEPRLVNGKKRWGNQTDNGQNKLSPSDTRWMDRSRTYPGIAQAMASQWVEFLVNTRVSKNFA